MGVTLDDTPDHQHRTACPTRPRTVKGPVAAEATSTTELQLEEVQSERKPSSYWFRVEFMPSTPKALSCSTLSIKACGLHRESQSISGIRTLEMVPTAATPSHSLPAVHTSSASPRLHQHLGFSCGFWFFIVNILIALKWYLTVALLCIS